MQENNAHQQTHKQEIHLEERLGAYYGPKLREQPLSQSAWHDLQSRLGPQRSATRQFRWPHRLQRERLPIPAYIQDAYMRVIYDAHVAYKPGMLGMLRCSFKAKLHEPSVSVTLLPKEKLRLLLPLMPERAVEQSELDTLLATGLARLVHMRQVQYWWFCAGAMSPFIIGCIAALLSWLRHALLLGIPIAIMLFVSAWLLLLRQRRQLVLASDALAVRWIGRSRTCQGLHALADRSRPQPHKRWATPSLQERIEHVCGPRVEIGDERLTLIR